MMKSIFLFLFSAPLLSMHFVLSQSTIQIYTENGIFVVPEGVYSITVECIGGGGGGARAATAYRGRGGGGGGAYAKSILAVTPFEQFSIEIGVGGAGGTSLNGGDGAAGGNSIFGNNLVLAVGGGGTLNDQNPGGQGGQAQLCIFNDVGFNGGNGGNGTASCSQCGTSGGGGGGAGSGGNGNSALGAAGGLEKLEYGGKGANGSSGTSDGANGFNYGGGGSGGRRASSGISRPGGTGANGVVVVTYNLCNQNLSGTDIISSCAPITWIDGNTYNASNNTATFLLEGAAQNGCDSLVSLNLTINNSATGTDVITACNSYTWIDGETYSVSNNSATFNIVGGAANGCDSLVTLNLTINNSATGTDVITACNSYTWIDGETYSVSNNTATFNIVGGAANGCDSLVTLNLTINNSATGTDIISSCAPITWIDGNTYTVSNNTATFNIVGGAANGCDSLVTLNLTINNSATGTDIITACNSYTWIDGETYTESNNTATFNIVGGAANGCDSLVTLNLTINNSTTGSDVIVANNSYTWIDGNTYFADNNTATFNLIGAAANGCDSLVTLNLTIISGDAPENNQPCGALNITSSGLTDLNTYAFLADMTCNNPSGNNTSASLGPVGASCGGTNGRSMWYTFTTPSCDVNGLVPFEIEFSTNNAGTNFNTKLAIFESDDDDCDGVFTELACNDDHNGAGIPNLCNAAGATTSTIVTNLQPNKQYWVYVDGFNAEFGDFVLSGRALTAPHGVAAVGNGTQIQLSTADMGAGLYTYYYKQVGSTGHSTFNSASALTNVRTLAPGNDYITQIMYRCGANAQQSQWYRTAPQTIALASTCALVSDMTCIYNGTNSYTLTWSQPSGDLFTNNGALSGYRIKRSPVGSTGVYTFSNPAVVCNNGTCSVTLPGNSPTGFNWTIETRCSANTVQVGNTTSCGPQAPEFTGNNDASNSTNRTLQHTFSFVNAEAGIEFVNVQMHDAYADFGLNTPMIGDYEMFVNSKNEITWRRVETAINTNFDFVIVPNPSNAMTTVHLNTVVEAGTFTIVDAMGRTINSGAISNTDNINFDAAQLQSGVYMVVVTVEGVQMTKRLVVAD